MQIMMGVHGNGLTALLWMRPTARSTVIEFFSLGIRVDIAEGHILEMKERIYIARWWLWAIVILKHNLTST